MKPRIKVVDIPTTATADEAERLLNAPCGDGYYLDKVVQTGLPDGIGSRAFYRLRVNL